MPERRSRPYPWPCFQCLADTVVPTIIDYDARVKHDGAIHELRIEALEVPRCATCGETTITIAADERISAALRLHLGLLTPEEITTGQDDPELDRDALLEHLCVGEETISKWKTGDLIQSKAMDNMLRFVIGSECARRFERLQAQSR